MAQSPSGPVHITLDGLKKSEHLLDWKVNIYLADIGRCLPTELLPPRYGKCSACPSDRVKGRTSGCGLLLGQRAGWTELDRYRNFSPPVKILRMTTTVATPTSAYWNWRGHRIHYAAAGIEMPGAPLLLVHGFGASTDHWRKNIAPLSGHRPVYAIDLLGFGRSAKPALSYSGELWRDQLHDFVSEVITRPVVAVGNSLGGYATLVLAADHPEQVEGLALLNGAGPFSDAKRPEGWQKLLGDTAIGLFRQEWASWLLFQYFRQRFVIRRTLLQVYRDPSAVTDQLIEDIYRPSCDPGAAGVFAAVFQTPPGQPIDVLLDKLDRPLLLLWGDSDPWMTVSRAERFHAAYPRAILQLIPAGHCPHDERPELVNQYLLDFAGSF